MGKRASYEGKKRLILEAAAELFSKRGYSATSIDDVARAVEVTKGNIYHYFKSKAHILVALQEIFFELYEANLAGFRVDETTDSVERLRRAVGAQVKTLCDNPVLGKVLLGGLLSELATLPSELQSAVTRRRRAYERVLAEIIEAVPTDLRLTDLPSDLAARALMASINSICIWYRKPPEDMHEKYTAVLVRQALRSVLRQEPVEDSKLGSLSDRQFLPTAQ